MLRFFVVACMLATCAQSARIAEQIELSNGGGDDLDSGKVNRRLHDVDDRRLTSKKAAATATATAEKEKKVMEATADECHDTHEWRNPKGYTCVGHMSYEEKGWCKDGSLIKKWAGGKNFGFPEWNCCVCGKSPTPAPSSTSGDACQDTPEWTNPKGYTCTGPHSYEEKGWCKDGKVVKEWTMGNQYGYPEYNCCLCGKANFIGNGILIHPPAPVVTNSTVAPDA